MLPICEKELNRERKRFEDLEKLSLECNTLFVDKLSKMEQHLNELKDLCPGRGLQVIIDDTNYVKADFINNCICNRSKT